MYWNKDNSSDNLSYRASAVLKKIREIKKKFMMTIPESIELRDAEIELGKIQDDCNHTYEVILLFHRHHKYCRYCDKEDFTYKP
jgi:hypothetical protein